MTAKMENSSSFFFFLVFIFVYFALCFENGGGASKRVNFKQPIPATTQPKSN